MRLILIIIIIIMKLKSLARSKINFSHGVFKYLRVSNESYMHFINVK